MSISSRIQEIEQHLTDDYSVLTLAGADLTNVDKNIINLKPTWQERLLYFINNGTDIVYNNWSKTTGTGTTLSLNNTVEAPMNIVFKGNTSQEGTPTPDSPQDIHVVTGDNTIKVEGKNLLNANGIYSSTSTTNLQRTYENGIATLIWSSGFNFYMTVDSSNTTPLPIDNTKTYTLSFYHKGNALNLRFDEGNANIITTSNDSDYTRYTYTFTNLSQFIIKFVRSDNSGTAYLKDFQLEYDSTATIYTPYTSQTYPINLGSIELCKIGDYQDSFLRTSGKNLCSGVEKQSNANMRFYCDKLDSKTFTISFKINESLISNTIYLIVNGSQIGSVGTLTTDSNLRVSRTITMTDEQLQLIQNSTTWWFLLYKSGANFTEPTEAQIEYGTSSTPYEPYGSGEWYKKAEIGKTIYTGSETWYESTNYYQAIISPRGIGNQALSSHFTLGASNGFTTTAGYFRIWDKTTFQTSSALTTWLGTHNTILYYALETPTYTPITDSTLIGQLDTIKKSYNEQTNISQTNDDLPFILDVSALEELS